MGIIKRLSDNVVNQIAAGEIVERPAAVIKELVENSLDAGATRVEVEFRKGGKSYMCVEDNGSGMPPDDALMSLECHSTSKIREAKDLSKIISFGFRGEAIPSIASVSRFSLKSKPNSQDAGTDILVDGGKLVYKKECGMPVGTKIEVSNLYNSVPARRKFMKTENTEAAHIVHCVKLFAIANPQVVFTLKDNARVVFRSNPAKDLKERVGQVWNKKLVNNLMDVDAEESGMILRGLIGEPGVFRSTRQEMITFVNGRPVENKAMSYALLDAYHGQIPKARYPVVFLFLDINPELVDVNVHPAKREVKFRQEGLIRQFVIRAAIDCLKLQTREEGFDFLKRASSVPTEHKISIPALHTLPRPTPLHAKSKIVTSAAQSISKDPVKVVKPELIEVKAKTVGSIKSAKQKNNWRFIGYLRGDYILFETESGLLVLNYRGALERVRYEEIWQSFKSDDTQISQPLLFPFPVELELLDADAFAKIKESLQNAGFQVELFGRNFYRIEAVPAWLDPKDVESFVRDIIVLVREHGGVPENRNMFYDKIAKMASVSKNKVERPSEVKVLDLTERLMSCEHSMTCPCGYLTYYEVGYGELEKRFGEK